MTRQLRLALALVTTTALALPAGASAATCANADALPSAANLPQVRRATLCLVNLERTRRGRPALRFQRALAGAANAYAAEMVRRGFFDHVSPSGSTLASRIKSTAYLSGTASWALGENLAWAGGSRASARDTVRAWMASAGHRRNILDGRFRELGVGIALGTPDGVDGATYATEYGTRRR